MGKKEKSQSCTPKGWCYNHLFELNPLHSSLYFRKPQKVRLCPKMNKNTKNFLATLPQINKDKKFYTPSFILQEEQNFYDQNDDEMKRNHNQRVIDLGEGMTKTIMVANHARKRKYCSVCGEEYQDYLQHIGQDSHKTNINRNRFTHYIKELQRQYNREKPKMVTPKITTDQFTEDCAEKVKQKQVMQKKEEEVVVGSVSQVIVMNDNGQN